MANRHKMQAKASGGRTYYAGGNSNVAKEAAEKKKGGKVSGKKSKMTFRARGGRTGSNTHPFSSAKTSEKGNLT